MLELNGAAPLLLNALGGSLFVARLLHAFGFSRVDRHQLGRFVGTVADLARAARGERAGALLVLGG